MKVLLLANVAKVGKQYTIVDVAPGYARNFLFPRGAAEAVTKSNAKRVADLQHKREVESKRQTELLTQALEKVGKAQLSISRKANDEGHLYAAVSKDEVAELLAQAVGVSVPAEYVHVEHPIKEIGEHKILARVGENEASFTLAVSAED